MKSLEETRASLAQGLSSIRGSAAVRTKEEADEDYWADIDVTKLRIRELRAALDARGLSTTGKKKHLQARLQQSVHEEKEEELEYLAMVEAAWRAEAALEESGSVYTCGLNRKGQLGLGDREDRSALEVVKELRGKGVMQVSAGGDIALALSENGNVFTWGGVGTGKAKPVVEEKQADESGRRRTARKKAAAAGSMDDEAMDSPIASAGEDGLPQPRLLESLQGEGVEYISCGPNHASAVSDSGDLYFWGDGTRGQLGTGAFSVETAPRLVDKIDDDIVVRQVAVGQTHSMVLTEEGTQVLTCGFSNSGKLGLGITERKGIKAPLNRYFPELTQVPALTKLTVMRIACSANHSACVTPEGLWTWGSGDGGRLGHGDHKDRLEPTLVEDLAGQIVVDVSLGFWHSAAIVQVPPIFQGGYLTTWGSAYHGQLAQSDANCVLRPTISQVCNDMRLLFCKLSCGPTHCFAQTVDGDLYSWGSNKHGELAREMQYEEDEKRQYTPIPGFVEGFNTIVDRIGRGEVISFACGNEFTVVATCRYTGESEEEMKLRIEEEEEAAYEAEQMARSQERVAKAKSAKQGDDDNNQAAADFDGRGCDQCDECPGFNKHIFRQYECKECGHNRARHTKPKIERNLLQA